MAPGTAGKIGDRVCLQLPRRAAPLNAVKWSAIDPYVWSGRVARGFHRSVGFAVLHQCNRQWVAGFRDAAWWVMPRETWA